MSTHFKIVIPSYNSVPWIGKTLRSIERQTYKNYDVCVIDDASTDPRQPEIIQEYSNRYGWHFIRNETNKKALYNIVQGTKILSPKDADVIMVIDGDDWLYSPFVFERLSQIYSDPNTWITYGQHVRLSYFGLGPCRPSEWWVRITRGYRKRSAQPWIFSQLRTYRAFLWKNIEDQHLRDESGEYFIAPCDQVIMYPMLEAAGSEHIKYVSDVLYVYNDRNPINENKVRAHEQIEGARRVRSKKKYSKIAWDNAAASG